MVTTVVQQQPQQVQAMPPYQQRGQTLAPQDEQPPRLSANEIGMEFVRQYYTLMSEAPEALYRLYSSESFFVHGRIRGKPEEPVRGQENIRRAIEKLTLKDTYTKIRQVDAYRTLHDLLVVLVCGDISTSKSPPRRFAQTIILAPQGPLKFTVVNDIFRYIDEFESDGNEGSEISSEGAPENAAPNDGHYDQQTANIPENNNWADQVNDNFLRQDVPVNVYIKPDEPQRAKSPREELIQQPQVQMGDNSIVTDYAQPPLPTPMEQAPPQTANEVSNTMDEDASLWALKQAAIAQQNAEFTTPPQEPVKEEPRFEERYEQEPEEAAPQENKPKGTFSYASMLGSNGVSPAKHAKPAPATQQPAAPAPVQSTPVAAAAAPAEEPGFPKSQEWNGGAPKPQRQTGGFRGRGGPGNGPDMNGRGGGGFHRGAPRGGGPQAAQPQRGPPRDQGFRGSPAPYTDDHQLFVGYLPTDVTEVELKNRFMEFGNVVEARLTQTGAPSIFGFVTFESKNTVQSLLERVKGEERLQISLRNDGKFVNIEEKRTKGPGGRGGPRGGMAGGPRGGMAPRGQMGGGYQGNQSDRPRFGQGPNPNMQRGDRPTRPGNNAQQQQTGGGPGRR